MILQYARLRSVRMPGPSTSTISAFHSGSAKTMIKAAGA